tara:strand:+ start:203 stop:1354 length:1152 start_codon:yes stop_codon:yes gene_type:complete
MKLFKSLLVAPATLGLLVPMSATANEVTINDFNPAEELAVTNSRVDGLEARLNNFEAGGFSETTTASFGANFYVGSTDTDGAALSTGESDDAISAGYDFQIGLTTSFTGEDSLDITIDAGNAGATGYAEFDGDDTTDKLQVDGVSYTFPLGGATVIVGDNTDGSALFTTACAYGGPSNTLDDCGNVNAGITNGGAMVGAAYDFDNGFTAAVGYAGTESDLMTEESTDAWGINGAFTGDNYGVSITYGVIEATSGDPATLTGEEDTYTALNGYYTPEGLPSISVGYEMGDIGGADSSVDEKESFFIGLTWDEIGPGSVGIALGYSDVIEGSEEEYMYEVYYDYPVNDGMTITPLVYTKEVSTAIHDGVSTDNTTGVMVKTSFSF